METECYVCFAKFRNHPPCLTLNHLEPVQAISQIKQPLHAVICCVSSSRYCINMFPGVRFNSTRLWEEIDRFYLILSANVDLRK